MTRPDLAIVGGGLLGRCLAWRAARTGASVVLYEAAGSHGENSAAWAAAGMIAPTTEAIDGDPEIASMGAHSLSLWPRWIAELPVPVFFRHDGTLLLWHRQDAQEAFRVEKALASRCPNANVGRVQSEQLDGLEPALASRFSQALRIPNEAQVDNREFLKAVAIALEDMGVECHWDTFVRDGEFPEAGFVVDCRGMGARCSWPRLRGCAAK